MRKIVLLGASGSIGMQTIDVIRSHPEEFKLIGFSVGRQVQKAIDILNEFKVELVCVMNQEDAKLLQKQYPDTKVVFGDQGLLELCEMEKCQIIVNALVGFVGLLPTLHGIAHSKDIALANKETLIVGGKFVKEAVKKYGVELTPIDSEHSAIFQCLKGSRYEDVDRLIVTASGGSFRDLTREQLKGVTLKQALAHPNWSMGAKITIDSATLMNKGFEVIEAHYLFDIDYEHIDVLIHRESLVHSLVQFKDTAVLAQLGTADMRLPIQYALTHPKRYELKNAQTLDLAKVSTLHFEKADEERYPFLRLAIEMGKKEGNACAILNAANEVAVHYFLEDKISFLDIEMLVFKAIESIEYLPNASLKEVIETDRRTRQFVHDYVKGVCA